MSKVQVKRSFSAVAQEELICPLCYELFRGLCEPKELDCAHVFCQICLLRIVGVGLSIVCPECRRVTNVSSEGGVASLKCVLRLRNLADKFANHCTDLSLRRTSTPHMTVGKTDVATCARHQGEKMHFLCVTCNVSICQFCLVRNHTPPSHEIQELQTSREELQQELENAIDESEVARLRIEENVGLVTKQITDTECALEEQYTKIDKHIEGVVEKIRESGESLKEDIRQMAESRMSSFNLERELLEDRAQGIKVTQATARNTRANLPDQVYTTRYKPVVKKLQMLCNDTSSEVKMNIRVPQFIPDQSPLHIQLGRIEMPVTAQAVSEFGDFEFARGIAAVPSGEGFAVTDFYGKQAVFFKNNDSYVQKTFLEVKERKYGPTDVTVTTDGDYLVASWVGLELFSATGVYKSAFSEDKMAVPHEGIYSVASTRDVILVGNIEQSSIAIHNDDGILKKTLKVGLKPYKIATNGTHVAICQEVTNRIAVVSLDSAEELFRVSIEGVNGICYENTSNSLLVGKTAGRRSVCDETDTATIEQYCAVTGQWINQVATGLYSPQALALTEDGTLAVADRKSVKVFQMN